MPEGNSIIDLGNLSKPADTLIKKVSEGIGGIFAPYQIVRIEKAKAKAAEIKANSDALVAKIETESNIELQEYQKRAMGRLVAEETRKQINIESITAKAIEDLDDDAKPENIDNDWIANFFDKCKLISDEEMQMLWGKVLAGEANTPGKFSKRTIEFISTMSKDDATSFQRLCRFKSYFNSALIIPIFNFDDSIYLNNVITQDLIRHLESIGLVNYNSFGFVTQFYGKIIANYYNSYFTLDFSNISNLNRSATSGNLELGVVTPTLMGTELSELVNSEPVPEFVDYLKQHLKIQKIDVLDMD